MIFSFFFSFFFAFSFKCLMKLPATIILAKMVVRANTYKETLTSVNAMGNTLDKIAHKL